MFLGADLLESVKRSLVPRHSPPAHSTRPVAKYRDVTDLGTRLCQMDSKVVQCKSPESDLDGVSHVRSYPK